MPFSWWRQGRRRWDQQTRTFKSTLAGLAEFAGWLAEAGVTLVGMEATGVYWKTVFQALEEQFECWLLRLARLRGTTSWMNARSRMRRCMYVSSATYRPARSTRRRRTTPRGDTRG